MTHRTLVPVAACALLLALAAPTVADESDGPAAKLIETKAGSIVSVKFVLQISIESGGQQREQEQNGRALGVVVDPCGLVMLPSQAFEVIARRPGRGRGGRGGRGAGPEVTAKPTDLRVVFPGDEKEHAAIMGAKDTKYGLAFVLINDLGDKKAMAVDLSKVAEPKVGELLYGVSRLDQGFDHAPICGRVPVLGKVSQPRTMWAISDAGSYLGTPLYTADGAVAGICALQRGVGQGTSTRPFLLPLDTVQRLVSRAKTEALRSLEEIREAEKAEKADEEPPKDGGDGKEGDEAGGEDDGR